MTLMERAQTGVLRAVQASPDPDAQEVSVGEMGAQGLLERQATVHDLQVTVPTETVHVLQVTVLMAAELEGHVLKATGPMATVHVLQVTVLMAADHADRVLKVTVLTETDHAHLVIVLMVAELEGHALQATVLMATVHDHLATDLTATDHDHLETGPMAIGAEVLTIEVAHHGSQEKAVTGHTVGGRVGTHGNKMLHRRTCRKAGVALHEGVPSKSG